MKELIQVLVQALVDAPELVSVREVHGNRTTVYELRVAHNDVGKIIGKKGRTAQALRVIMGAVAAKNGMLAILEIVDPYDPSADVQHHQNPRTVEIEKVHRLKEMTGLLV